MIDARWPRHRTISTLALACGAGIGLVLCYLLAIPFLPALVGSFTLAVLFSPLDDRIRQAIRLRGFAAACTTAIVALIVVVPTLLVVGALLSETDRSARLIGTLIDADTWTRGIDARPRLAPILRAVSERFDIPDLIRTATNGLERFLCARVVHRPDQPDADVLFPFLHAAGPRGDHPNSRERLAADRP